MGNARYPPANAMRRLTIASRCSIGSEKTVAVTLPPLASNDSYVQPQPASNTPANWRPVSVSSASGRCVAANMCCSYCDAPRRKRRRNSLAYSPAPCSTQQTVYISHALSCACVLTLLAPYRQAPSADESPSPSILIDARSASASAAYRLLSPTINGWMALWAFSSVNRRVNAGPKALEPERRVFRAVSRPSSLRSPPARRQRPRARAGRATLVLQTR